MGRHNDSGVLLRKSFETAADAGEKLGDNPVLSWAMSRPLWVLPLIVFVTGPVVLAIAWAVSVQTHSVHGRGLTTFLSATLGDWFLLPVIATLAALCMRDLGTLGLGRLGPRLRLAPIAWAVLGTLGLHLLWYSDAGNANWTQPVGDGLLGLKLVMNLPGALHALFFVMIQWWVAEFVLRLVLALPGLPVDAGDGETSPAPIISALMAKLNAILAASLFFGLLLAWDYRTSVLAPKAAQTWVWLAIPVLVLVLAVALNTLLQNWLGDTLVAEDDQALTKRNECTSILVWAVPLSALSFGAILLVAPPVIGRLGLLTGACVAIAALGATNVWAEVYFLQGRQKVDAVGWWTLASVGLVMLAGFLLSLRMVLAVGPVQTLGQIVVPWLVALAVALVASFGAAALGVMLAKFESHDPKWQAVLEDATCEAWHFGEEPPEHDIRQNVAQYGLLYGLLPMFAATYVILAVPLMLTVFDAGTQVSLLFGYVGVVVAAVTFPLYGNMAHVRDLEARVKEGGHHKRLLAHLNADKDFTMGLSLAVGAVAALAVMWLWIEVLDSILGYG